MAAIVSRFRGFGITVLLFMKRVQAPYQRNNIAIIASLYPTRKYFSPWKRNYHGV